MPARKRRISTKSPETWVPLLRSYLLTQPVHVKAHILYPDFVVHYPGFVANGRQDRGAHVLSRLLARMLPEWGKGGRHGKTYLNIYSAKCQMEKEVVECQG